MTVVEAELGGRLVHQVGEGGLRPGQALGNNDAGVVAGLDDDTPHQLTYRHLRINLKKHA